MQTIGTLVMDAQKIAEAVRELRKERGFTQEKLAEKAGFDTKTIQRLEAGQLPKLSTLECVAKALGVTVPDLEGGSLQERVRRSEQEVVEVKRQLQQVVEASSVLAALSGVTPPDASSADIEEYTSKLTIRLMAETPQFHTLPNVVVPKTGSVALVGVGGVGKTWLSRRCASERARSQCVISAAAKYFEGDVDRWLDGAVAFGAVTAAKVVRAALGRSLKVTLLVDGVNECPKDNQAQLKDLLDGLAARGVELVLSARFHEDLPAATGKATVALTEWTLDQRQELARSLASVSELSPATEAALARLKTPMQVALAMRGHGPLDDVTPLALLLRLLRNAFPEETSEAMALMRVLSKTMATQLRHSLDEAAAVRLLTSYCERNSVRPGLVDKVFAATSVIARDAGRVSFQHEYIESALLVDRLVDVETDEEWANALADPRNEALAPLMLDGANSDERLRAALSTAGVIWGHRSVAGAGTLYESDAVAECLRGEHGARARRVVGADLAGLLDAERERVRGVAALVHTPQPGGRKTEYDTELQYPAPLSRYHFCLFVHLFVRASCGNLELIDRLSKLIDHTIDCAGDKRVGVGKAFAVWRLLVINGDVGTGAGVVVTMTGTRWGHTKFDEATTLALIDLLSGRGQGSVLWLLEMVQKLGAHTPQIAAAALPVLSRLVKSENRYIVYAAVELLPILAVNDDLRGKMREVAEGALAASNDLLLNSLIAEALSDLGAEFGTPGEDVEGELRWALACPDDEANQQVAAAHFAMQWEAFGVRYYEAISSLSDDERMIFYAMVVLGSRPPAAFGLGIPLAALIEVGSRSTPLIEKAFRSRAAPPSSDAAAYQEAIEIFILANGGLGKHVFAAQIASGPLAAREETWLLVGRLIHALASCTDAPTYVWPRLIDLFEVSVDVLSLVVTETTSLPLALRLTASLREKFENELRDLFHRALAERDRLRPALPFGSVASRVIAALGVVGDSSSRELLLKLSEGSLSAEVVAAVRRIDERMK